MHLIFTYGTLRPSLYPKNVDRFGLVPMGSATLQGHYQLIDLGNFPGLISEPRLPVSNIIGEVVSIGTLEQADRYEGCKYGKPGNLYDRVEVEVLLKEGAGCRIQKVWTYVFNHHENRNVHDPIDPAGAKMAVIDSGDWAKRG